MILRIALIINWILLIVLVGSSFAQESSVTVLTIPFNPLPLHSQNLLPYRTVIRPRVGLALSGGGARGFAQIGVLKALEEAQIPIDMIAGTSIGAVIGGLYAIDYSPAMLQQIIEGIDWSRLFSNAPRRRDLFLSQKQENARHFFQLRFDGIKPYIPQALSAGQQLSAILNDLHLQSRYSYRRDFDNLRFPYRAIATDFISGERVILKDGDLSQAMLASMAIPLLFTPTEIEGRLLVDGGLVDNFPTDVVREMGADLVIGVNTLSPLRTVDLIQLPWEQADQVTSIMQKPFIQKLMQNADILISPDLDNRISTDFSKPAESIEIGYRAAKKLIPEIYTRLKLPSTPNKENFSFIPGRIEFQGLKEISSDSISKWLTTKAGVTTDVSVIQGDLYLLYERGYFYDVRAKIIKDRDQFSVTYMFDENPVIHEIIIEGNTIFPGSLILQQMKTHSEKIFNFHTGAEDYRNLTQIYRNQDYTLAEIRDVRFDQTTGTLFININEGIIGTLIAEGNIHTRSHVVLRELPLGKGDVFNSKKAQQGISNIYSTGLFDRVYLSITSSNPDSRLIIKLVEKKYFITKFGARYGLERGTQGFIETQDENMFGIGAKSLIHLQYGSRDELAMYQLRTDRIFNTYLTAKFDMHFSRTQNRIQEQPKKFGEYEDRRYGGVLSLGAQIARFGTVTVESRVEDIRVASDPVRYSEKFKLSTLTFRSIIDTQDKYPFPHRGNYTHMYYEIANRLFGGDLSYNKLYSSFEWYLPLSRYHVLHPHTVFGTADETLPFAERFRLGGDKSLFGFRENVLHGRTVLGGSMEYRIQIKFDRFFDGYLSMRYDLAGIWNKFQNIQLHTMHRGYGTSFAFDFPIGPLEFGYGNSGQSKQVYFSLGYRF